MGFFDKLFGGKAASETKFSGQKMTVMLPIDGKVIPLEQLPDETFASAILGPGCGVEPTGDTDYAPCDGRHPAAEGGSGSHPRRRPPNCNGSHRDQQ